jgi:hypothetical protein
MVYSTSQIVNYIIIFIFIVILIAAIAWEVNDAKRILQHRSAHEGTEEERERSQIFFGCHMYQNNVTWRGAYIAASIATLIILYIFSVCRLPIRFEVFVLIFGAVFLPVYIIGSFKSYHLYRPICGKVNRHLILTGSERDSEEK